MYVSVLDRANLPDLAATLAAAGLPVSDLDQPERLFFRFEDCRLAGYAGLEGAGPDRLLRSVVVVPERRDEGLGSRILAEVESRAQAWSIARLHLLKTTAAPFFTRRGYELPDRASAPSRIAHSAEFTALCPASATYLVKALAPSATAADRSVAAESAPVL